MACVESEDQEPSEPLWVLKWVVNERFWENVASQTISTLLAAVVITFVAAFLGVAYEPEVRFALLVGAIYGLFAISSGVGAALFAFRITKNNPNFIGVLVFIVELVLISMIIGLLGPVMETAVASWAGYTGPLVTR